MTLPDTVQEAKASIAKIDAQIRTLRQQQMRLYTATIHPFLEAHGPEGAKAIEATLPKEGRRAYGYLHQRMADWWRFVFPEKWGDREEG